MAGQILVALRRNERLEQIIPYIERIAQPGMRIVFLIHYPVDGGFGWVRDHWVETESPREAALAGKKILERYSLEEQRQSAEYKVFLAQEALRKRGVEIVADVYTGCLRKVVEGYTRRGDVHLIMMRGGIGLRIMRFLHGTIPFFSLLKRPSFSPVLLLHPDHVGLMSGNPSLTAGKQEIDRAQANKVRLEYFGSIG